MAKVTKATGLRFFLINSPGQTKQQPQELGPLVPQTAFGLKSCFVDVQFSGKSRCPDLKDQGSADVRYKQPFPYSGLSTGLLAFPLCLYWINENTIILLRSQNMRVWREPFVPSRRENRLGRKQSQSNPTSLRRQLDGSSYPRTSSNRARVWVELALEPQALPGFKKSGRLLSSLLRAYNLYYETISRHSYDSRST